MYVFDAYAYRNYVCVFISCVEAKAVFVFEIPPNRTCVSVCFILVQPDLCLSPRFSCKPKLCLTFWFSYKPDLSRFWILCKLDPFLPLWLSQKEIYEHLSIVRQNVILHNLEQNDMPKKKKTFTLRKMSRKRNRLKFNCL